MRPPSEPTSDGDPVGFLVVAFSMSWLCGGIAGLGNTDVLTVPTWLVGVSNLGFLLGPTAGALWVRRNLPGGAARALLRDARPAGLRWYGIAAAAGAAGACGIAVLMVATGSPLRELGTTTAWLSVPLVLIATTPAALAEEVGWRATLLPSLRHRFGHRWAVLAVGTTWGLWHLPLLWTDSGINSAVPLYAYPTLALGLSSLLTWLYDIADGSPIVTAIAHGSMNATMTPLLLASYDHGELDRLYAVAVIASSVAGTVFLVMWQRNERSAVGRIA